MAQVQLLRLDCRVQNFKALDCLATRMVIEARTRKLNLYCIWAPKDGGVDISVITDWDTMMAADIKVLMLPRYRIPVIKAMIQTAFSEAEAAHPNAFGMVLEHAPWDLWWESEGKDLDYSQARPIDLAL